MKRTYNPSTGIRCPKCNGTRNSVAETRQVDGSIKRTRVCECGQRFYTAEKFEKIPESLSVNTIGSDDSSEAT